MASSDSQAAKRYAAALFTSCRKNELDAVARHLNNFATVVEENFDLRNVLLNPTFSDEERDAALAALMKKMKITKRTQKFIGLLIERDRQQEVRAIADAFASLVNKSTNRASALIRTASKLDSKTQDALKRALEKRTGKTLDMSIEVDPSLIGGIRAEVGTLVFDGTIRAELDRLKETLRPV